MAAGITERRRGREFAESVRYLAEEAYPKAEEIQVVLDNLSTYTAAFYEASYHGASVALTEAYREFCYTPVHGSCLNMAEIELSVLVWQRLKRRLADIETLRREARGWEKERNRLSVSGRLALHDSPGAHQAPEPLPISETVTEN